MDIHSRVYLIHALLITEQIQIQIQIDLMERWNLLCHNSPFAFFALKDEDVVILVAPIEELGVSVKQIHPLQLCKHLK
jgi:hypothetical protein